MPDLYCLPSCPESVLYNMDLGKTKAAPSTSDLDKHLEGIEGRPYSADLGNRVVRTYTGKEVAILTRGFCLTGGGYTSLSQIVAGCGHTTLEGFKARRAKADTFRAAIDRLVAAGDLIVKDGWPTLGEGVVSVYKRTVKRSDVEVLVADKIVLIPSTALTSYTYSFSDDESSVGKAVIYDHVALEPGSVTHCLFLAIQARAARDKHYGVTAWAKILRVSVRTIETAIRRLADLGLVISGGRKTFLAFDTSAAQAFVPSDKAREALLGADRVPHFLTPDEKERRAEAVEAARIARLAGAKARKAHKGTEGVSGAVKKAKTATVPEYNVYRYNTDGVKFKGVVEDFTIFMRKGSSATADDLKALMTRNGVRRIIDLVAVWYFCKGVATNDRAAIDYLVLGAISGVIGAVIPPHMHNLDSFLDGAFIGVTRPSATELVLSQRKS